MRKHLPWLGLLAVAAAPLFIGLGGQLFETDPAQYAEVARRMLRTGDLFSLHDNFGVFLNKPPMTMWLEALSMRALGVTSLAVRLPSLLAALVLLAAVARIGRLLFDARTGALAAVFLAGSFALQLMVADPKVDMVVTCTMALSVWALLEARTRPWMLWLAWAFAGAGVMTKGPIGLAVPAAAVFPEAVRWRWGAAEPGTLWSRVARFKPVRGVLVVLAVMAPWYRALIAEHGWAGARYLIWEQSFSRVLHQSGYRNPTTPLFFLHTALWAFLPFTPILLWELWQRAAALARRRTLPADETRTLWWWLLIPFAVISAAEFRLPQYLFWLAPPAALLSARAVCRTLDAGEARALKVLSGISLGLGVVACAGVGVVLEASFPPGSRLVEALWIAGCAAAFAGLVLVARRWSGALRFGSLCLASTAGLSMFFAGYLHPALSDFQPDQAWGAIAQREDPKGTSLLFAMVSAGNAAAFYADRPATEVGSLEELAEKVNRSEVQLAVVPAAGVEPLRRLGIQVEPIAERPSFTVSRPSLGFLRASTRPKVVQRLVLLRLRPAAVPVSPRME